MANNLASIGNSEIDEDVEMDDESSTEDEILLKESKDMTFRRKIEAQLERRRLREEFDIDDEFDF